LREETALEMCERSQMSAGAGPAAVHATPVCRLRRCSVQRHSCLRVGRSGHWPVRSRLGRPTALHGVPDTHSSGSSNDF